MKDKDFKLMRESLKQSVEIKKGKEMRNRSTKCRGFEIKLLKDPKHFRV